MSVTPLYAGLLALLFVLLSVRVIGARRAAKVAIGDGGDKALLRRMRVQANCAEYVPVALLLLALAELQRLPGPLLHGLGLMLLTGRLIHAVGVSQEHEPFALRVGGMAMTLTVIVVAALANIALALGLVPPGLLPIAVR